MVDRMLLQNTTLSFTIYIDVAENMAKRLQDVQQL